MVLGVFARVLVVAVALIFMSPSSWSRERHEFYNGARSLAMGGAYVVSVNDETALALNPAALGKLRDFYGTIIDPEIEIGAKLINMYRSRAFSQPTKIGDGLPTAMADPGNYFYGRTTFFPSFVAKNFGIGVLLNSSLATKVSSDGTSAELFHRDDMALLLGYNFRLWEGRIKIGFTGKMVSRIEVNEETFDPTQSLSNDDLAAAGLLKAGTGYGADVGLVLTAPWKLLPSIGFVARDVGNTNYTNTLMKRVTSATEVPAISEQDVDAGISISPIHSNNVRSVWTLEYRSLLKGADEPDKAKLIHFGSEFNIGDVVFLRFGYNQRYWTAGAELASEKFQFQLATYGEEVGDVTNPVEDRRYVLKAAFRF